MKHTEARSIEIYDTTLRDGTQREGISLSCDDKLRIAERLDAFGVGVIEGGWPGSNPKDAEFFQRARERTWHHAKLAAFGSTCRAGIAPQDDANLQALIDSEAPVCTIFGKTWTLHVTDILRISLEENLRMIEGSVHFLASRGRRVIYDAEHFFDGYRADANYALETLKAAARGGADTIALCDTNGGSMPWEVYDIVAHVREALAVHAKQNASAAPQLGIHTHNDTECGVANALAAVRAGAMQVQGTINGYGERCGNANLCSIIPGIELKLGLHCLPRGKLHELSKVARFVAEVANLAPDEHLAYVGRSAFAHKGGVHVSAVRRNADSYQHIEPSLVGNEMRVVVSELSGRSNLLSKAEEYGVHLEDANKAAEVLAVIKELEARGFSFEAAEASVALMLKRRADDYAQPFELIDYVATVENRRGRGLVAEATVKLRIGDEVHHTAAEGEGPVNALDGALRKALRAAFPSVEQLRLTDYKVRILDGSRGTRSTTRVLLDMSDGHRRWSTVGASNNIIEASCHALLDGYEYGLLFASDAPTLDTRQPGAAPAVAPSPAKKRSGSKVHDVR